MSDILKSIAQFTDVPPGGTVAAPHGLNVKGRPEIPDELTVDNGAFTATADGINVTVTNGSASAASVSVLCEMWHSIPRVFGKSNQDVQDSLSVRPFVGAGAGSNTTGSDELVKASIADTTPGFLVPKITAGEGISLAILNPGADEQVEISAPGSTSDELVKATSADTTPGFLLAKLAAGNGIGLSVLNGGDDEQVMISVPALTTMLASIQNLASGLSGNFEQVLLHPTPIQISAALLNGAPAGTMMLPFYAECRNDNGTVMAWANFEVKEIASLNEGEYVPTEAVVDPDVGVPSISNSAWVGGQLTSSVTFDTDAGATKVYAPGDEVYAELKMSPTDLFLGFYVAPVIQTFVVVA